MALSGEAALSGSPQIVLLPDGRRLHLQHGPIDIIAEARGDIASVRTAYQAAGLRFGSVLAELVQDLTVLRQPPSRIRPDFVSSVSARMYAAVKLHSDRCFVTPMAAVAGAVAEDILQAMRDAVPGLDSIIVNNGGDIALHVAGDSRITVGLVSNADAPRLDGDLTIDAASPVRGIATSGWRGRSQSLGIADSVTVLATAAATADVAATLIANAVNIDHPVVRRAPASSLRDDTDLGDRLVTVDVGGMDRDSVEAALEAGRVVAADMADRGLILSASLMLQGVASVVSATSSAEASMVPLLKLGNGRQELRRGL